MDLGLVVGIVLALVGAWTLMLLVFWLLRPKDVPLRAIVGVIPDLLRLLRALITDRTVPLDVRAALVFLFLWIVSPIDLIPEFLPGIGPLDDVIVTVVALRYTRRRLGIDDLRRRWTGSADGFAVLTQVIGAG